MQLTAMEWNASPTPSPVAAGFLVAPGSPGTVARVAVTPGVGTLASMDLDPIAFFPNGTVSVAFPAQAGRDTYRAAIYGATGSLLDHFGLAGAPEIYALGWTQRACAGGCSADLVWVRPVAIASFLLCAEARSADSRDGSVEILRYDSMPVTESPGFLPSGTVSAFPSASSRAVSYANSTGVMTRFARFSMRPSAGGAAAWEVVAPGLGPGQSGSAALPLSYPAGIPSTYGPQAGTSYEGRLEHVAADFVVPGDLSAPAYFGVTRRVAYRVDPFVF